MKTNFREHFLWSLFLTPFVFYYLKCAFTIESLIFIIHFIIGGIFPDIDLCLSPSKFPKVKRLIYFCKSLCSFTLCYYNSVGVIFGALVSMIWTNFYLFVHLLQSTGLFVSIGCKPKGFHRESLFHSLTFWYLCIFSVNKGTLSIFLDLLNPEYIILLSSVLNYGLKPLAYGSVAHLVLDHIGSALQYMNFPCFVQLLSTIFFILVFEYWLFGTDISWVTNMASFVFKYIQDTLYIIKDYLIS